MSITDFAIRVLRAAIMVPVLAVALLWDQIRLLLAARRQPR